jgi:hypothetical protein
LNVATMIGARLSGAKTGAPPREADIWTVVFSGTGEVVTGNVVVLVLA